MLAHLLDRHAADRPEALALVAGSHVLTWKTLQTEVRRVAGGLSAHGVSAGVPVALLLPNCPAFVIGFLAAARLGAVAIPLSTDLKTEQIRAVLDASGCRTLLADNSFATLCRRLVQDGSIQRAFLRDCEDGEIASVSRLAADNAGSLAAPLPSEHDAVLQQFTSGTTGQPSRVVRTHGALAHMTAAFAAAARISAADRILAVIPFCHGHGLNNTLLTALSSGATLVLQERFDRRETLRILCQERITIFPAVPFLAAILAETRSREPIDLSALRLCVTAGSALSRDTWTKAKDRLGILLRQSYGSTETGMVTFDMDGEACPESVGRPLDGVRVTAFGSDGAELSSEAEGELAVQSPWAASWRATASGRQSIADARGWIRMRDVGRFDPEGRLYVTGNNGLLINVAGRKVNPGDVEGALMSHPKVREAAVLPLRDAYGEQAVQAVVVSSEACSADELLAHCRERLAAYQVPRIIQFRSTLPRSAAGKILRRALDEMEAPGH